MDRPRDDAIENNPDHETPGGRTPEPVENRPNVGTTTPEDYPAADREQSRPDGAP
ncbi:hypothetical protein U1839_02125 [Sphingomonas sp. RT2P30]|uniref:hypothetical protein n=1 Tax=Parasphingomonas halimpatiens TaxID=3096162 RepID=UPI002FCA4CCF